MFNGYNETPLITYNEYNQERLEKKQDNVAKWSYGHESGVQPTQTLPNNRHSEFWPGKGNFLGVGNVVKCNCTGCYLSSEKQSYQGDTTRHRPWLPRTFPVPLNGSSESCKLPAYQWNNGFPSQGSCYSENSLPYFQESGGKYPFYRTYQNTRLPEPNQPGVITSLKEAEFGKKEKNEMMSRGQEPSFQNGAYCNPGCNLPKRPDARKFFEPNDKHTNLASYSIDQHLVRLPVAEPFVKSVPSNLSQTRVPSNGYRSMKDNMVQSYIDLGYCDPRKVPESAISGDKRPESFPAGQLPTGPQIDYSHPQETEPQKLFFDNNRHSNYYSRNNVQDVIKRNNQTLDNRKDCTMIMSEQNYNLSRPKYQDTGKPLYETFYTKDFDKKPENPASFQRSDDAKNEKTNVHARLPRSALLFNDPRFSEKSQNSFSCQSNPNSYRNYFLPEYSYQDFSSQDRYEYPEEFQRNEQSELKAAPQQTQACDQFPPSHQIPGHLFEPLCQQNSDKSQQFYLEKESVQTDTLNNRKANYLEAIRSEEISKNGTNKISPLRLLRKKKFINVPQELPSSSKVDSLPGLDVRKFWSTWADEEEENVAPTQMVVLDCQNIDPEQANFLHLYETDPVRAVQLETGAVLKSVKESTIEQMQQPPSNETKIVEQTNMELGETQKIDDKKSLFVPELESKSIEPKSYRKGKSGKKKTEVMDKWTEKKFDFLKRAEESKAAEILRHEEKKKKIIETRLSLQQSLKKTEKPLEKNLPFDENSQSETEDGSVDISSLPTCEYRKNKFLDYSEKKVLDSNKGKVEPEKDEVRKEERVKAERSDGLTDGLVNVKLKGETGFEMEDILKKISEINFEGSEIKFGDKDKAVRKTKKQKKKKTDQPETDDKMDKLTVETVTKPTIKFSIQKSHDLKISFRVLNNKEEGEGVPQSEGSILEDSKNSTEFTLRYKSFQRDTDRISFLKKRRFRKKKRISGMKTPVLKIRKSRYMEQEEKDPLAVDDDEPVENTFENKLSSSEGFQVQETVDSAKIKLTFKRHRENFKTENKNNSKNGEEVDEEENNDNEETNSKRKELDEVKAHEIGVESFLNSPYRVSNKETYSPPLKPEKSRNLSASTGEENYDFESSPAIFAEFPSNSLYEVELPENIFKEKVKCEETDEVGRGETEANTIYYKEAMEEIKELSSDFINNTKPPVIEINNQSEDSDGIENPVVKMNSQLEKPTGIKFSECSSESKMEEDENKWKNNQTDLLDLISVEGVVDAVDEAKITESLVSCFDDSLGDHEFKKSPTEIIGGSENSLEYLIGNDFSPSRECSKPATPEISVNETEPQNQTEAESRDGNLSNFDSEKVEESPSHRGNPQSEIESYVEGVSSRDPETHSSTPSNPVPDGPVDPSKYQSDNNLESSKYSSDDSSVVVDNCPIIKTEQSIDKTTKLTLVTELEDGEIVDSSDEVEPQTKISFIPRKIDRRHSISKESQCLLTWSKNKFSKGKSCPPKLTFLRDLDIPVEEIPLPVGPPPLESCWDCKENKTEKEAKEKPKESIFERVKESKSPFGLNGLEKRQNPSLPIPSPQLTIINRNSRIKFSFSRISKLSKLNFNDAKTAAPLPLVEAKIDDSDKKEPTLKECLIEEVPKVAAGEEKRKNDLKTFELLHEDVEEKVQVEDTIADSIRDEFYECEDIPTSEDLTNGGEIDNEKVNDDKFRNIMQNCLDNAKKFLNVGNLKLFSYSVDDLLELDCQPELSLVENELEKSTNHISRDVLLTSIEDREDLDLSENVQSGDVSVDFVPSFCSDICPEILPVDNWPYLEEEVTSSPIKLKQDETDLISALECPIFGKTGRKRVASATSFRRASDDNFRTCSNVGQRRNTIDTFTSAPFNRDISDVKSELLLLKNEKQKSLKCRLSLEKLTNKQLFEFKNEKSLNGVAEKSKNFDYKSPSWQPKVMLLRISKPELRKILTTKTYGKLNERSRKFEKGVEPALKKQKSDPEVKALEKGTGEKLSATVARSDVERKRKKSRFRNLHTKRKTEPESAVSKKEAVDPEVFLAELFKNCNMEKTNGKESVKIIEDFKREKKELKEKSERHRDSESRKHGRHEPNHESKDGRKEKRTPHWVCKVCGFDVASERVVHIKNHPFHCQSCHLAFKTESHFISHLTKKHKDIRNQHHCLLCELSFDTEEQYQSHLDTREHKHLESVEKNTINTLFTLLTGAPCPVLGLVESKPEWLPNQAGTVHFYHQATPLSLALQYLKMHRDLSSFSTASSTHPS